MLVNRSQLDAVLEMASCKMGDSGFVSVNRMATRSVLPRLLVELPINTVSQPIGGLVQIWTLFRLINTN